MESRLARRQRDALFEAVQRLTPTQRLEAWLAHCRLVAGLYLAGPTKRPDDRQRPQ